MEERYILHRNKNNANCNGHILRKTCLLKHATAGKVARYKQREGKEDDVSRHWVNLRNSQDTGNLNRKH